MKIGLVDADLLDGGTRHPNLALLKIAGFLKDNNLNFELIINDNTDLSKYNIIYLSKVFTFTKEPQFIQNLSKEDKLNKLRRGGTGYYGEDDPKEIFSKNSK